MTAYRLLNNIFQFQEAFVDFQSMRAQFTGLKVWFPQENETLFDKLKGNWTPVAVTFGSGQKSNPAPDISVWNNSCVVLSGKARESLRCLLDQTGEVLPLKDGYFLYNCLESVGGEAIDPQQTIIDIESEESAHLPKSLGLIDRKIEGRPLFKPSFAHNSFLICQDEFKEITESQCLGGLLFEQNLAQIFPRKG